MDLIKQSYRHDFLDVSYEKKAACGDLGAEKQSVAFQEDCAASVTPTSQSVPAAEQSLQEDGVHSSAGTNCCFFFGLFIDLFFH